MFITFSSKAYENISYFNTLGKQLIVLMGHSGAVPGAIKAVELPDALQKLQQSFVKPQVKSGFDDDEPPEIGLEKRAIPLIHLLQASIKNNCDVLWAAAKSP